MERIWLKHYPPGVPADIDVTQYPSLVELLEESFVKFADRKSFICMDKSISYRDLDEMSQAFGAFLQSKGLPKGARVVCARYADASITRSRLPYCGALPYCRKQCGPGLATGANTTTNENL